MKLNTESTGSNEGFEPVWGRPSVTRTFELFSV